METQSSQTKRCWTPAKVQHEILIATVNHLEKVALWHWPRELLIRGWIFEMNCKEKHNIVIFFFTAKLTDNLCTHCCCGRHHGALVTTWSRGVTVSLGDCLCVCGDKSDKLVQDVILSRDWLDWPSSLNAGEEPLLLLLAYTLSSEKMGGHFPQQWRGQRKHLTGIWQSCHPVDGLEWKHGKMKNGQGKKRGEKNQQQQTSRW